MEKTYSENDLQVSFCQGGKPVAEEESAETLVGAVTRELRSNACLGVFIWFMAGVVCMLYFLEVVPAFFNGIEFASNKLGKYWFAVLISAVAGGLIPSIQNLVVKRVRRLQKPQIEQSTPSRLTLEYELYLLCYNMCFWGLMGAYVVEFYRWQGIWFGTDKKATTIVIKTVMDQFVFSAVLHVPMVQLSFTLRDSDLNLVKFRKRMSEQFTSHALLKGWWLPGLVGSTWFIWIPSLTVIYSLPAKLQQPVQAIIMCFWSILQMATADHQLRIEESIASKKSLSIVDPVLT
mmetsp:Transcript_49094/g.91470  ORF Transcript_49094/g.91470 Transcript_49094/m.91470 type:complete len:290 (-) Transcript_49094:72-941(-)|eukprot:CAMPEP_0114260132 /NCGR_PEP_ID=MMETSP0058-20121206/20296_1 /TAXON_ID=36894 /ORGANISM="Pyramimonas parkeae, CCMP726" /LENGTH=289 /DNA_ID=CAMNT_0001375291 /DNA_START=1 /DNA_END=870 /DNA_ORIENTATION=+